ncbi:MAG: LamG domain-containing protein [Gemmatales bacterium]|nr:LamG domain-containing protein [Gemmatales bacterium]
MPLQILATGRRVSKWLCQGICCSAHYNCHFSISLRVRRVSPAPTPPINNITPDSYPAPTVEIVPDGYPLKPAPLLSPTEASPSAVIQVGPAGYSLRFFGSGQNDVDRVKIPIDPPTPADVGETDFTIEFWIKGLDEENNAYVLITCGENNDWINGNIVMDRDRFTGRAAKYGLSINLDGTLVLGMVNANDEARTLCGTTSVLDGRWHHIVVQRRRSDGWLWLYKDGRLEAQGDGPDGDISYTDNAPLSRPGPPWCQGPGGAWGGICRNEPFIVLGAEKHDADQDAGTLGSPMFPSFSGWLDELRFSNILRYVTDFELPKQPFAPDGNTLALYHFDEGPAGPCTGTVLDSSGASGGPSHGQCFYGGAGQAGPLYVTDQPFP